MNTYPKTFKWIFRPVIMLAARRALVGRNRARHEPTKGRFTKSEVDRVVTMAWDEFDRIAPDVSREPTVGSRMNVRLAALTLAMMRCLLCDGIDRTYAIELVSDVCWNIYQYWGRVGGFMSRLLGHRANDVIKNHGTRVRPDGSWPMSFPFNPPGYRAQYAPVKVGLGFNVIRCPIAEYFRAQGAADLAVGTWCMLDYPLAEMLGMKLARSRTLAAGDDQCDFRWFEASISSRQAQPPKKRVTLVFSKTHRD